MQSFQVFKTKNNSDLNCAPQEGGAMSGTNTIYSELWSGEDADGYSLHVVWSGTPNGTFTLWQSDILKPGLADDTDWVQDTSFSPTNPSGSAGKFHDDAGNAKALHKRLKYVNSSGSGTVLAYVTVPILS